MDLRSEASSLGKVVRGKMNKKDRPLRENAVRSAAAAIQRTRKARMSAGMSRENADADEAYARAVLYALRRKGIRDF